MLKQDWNQNSLVHNGVKTLWCLLVSFKKPKQSNQNYNLVSPYAHNGLA